MEFCKDRVFTALNSDELSAGDKVIGGNTLADLKYKVGIETIDTILDEGETYRFTTKEGEKWLMVLLVERKENCTNCGGRFTCIRQKPEHPELTKCCNYKHYECSEYKPKTSRKPRRRYRPFKNIDELVKVWVEKTKPYRVDTRIPPLIMPLIWVREKGCEKSADLITCYGSKGITVRGKGMYFDTLFAMFEFLDGSPCGVEVK